jgi:hypothetical protein
MITLTSRAFVGRDAELEQLRQALERADTGHGQVVAVVGDAGVGKSRLFWEFTHWPRTQGWLIVESSSVFYGKATAFLPLIALLRTYFQIEGRDDTRKIRAPARRGGARLCPGGSRSTGVDLRLSEIERRARSAAAGGPGLSWTEARAQIQSRLSNP